MPFVEFAMSPYGRIGRLAFLFGSLALLVVNNIVLWSLGIKPGTPPGLIGGLVALALCWAPIVLTIKRFHDLGLSGWWVLLPTGGLVLAVVSFGFLGAAAAVAQSNASAGLGLASTGGLLAIATFAVGLFSLWQLIKLFFFAGNRGPNGYGTPPRLARDLLGASDDEIDLLAAAAHADEPAAAAATTQVTRFARNKPAPIASSRPAGFGRRGR